MEEWLLTREKKEREKYSFYCFLFHLHKKKKVFFFPTMGGVGPKKKGEGKETFPSQFTYLPQGWPREEEKGRKVAVRTCTAKTLEKEREKTSSFSKEQKGTKKPGPDYWVS